MPHKPIQVYSHTSNPAIDTPVYFISRSEAEIRIEKGYAVAVSATAIQNKPPIDYTVDERNVVISGLFNEAWAPRLSDCYLVWQMRSSSSESSHD